MDYTQSAELMNNSIFRGRVKVCCLKFADSIMIEPATVPAHNSRMKWANNTYQQPDMIAAQTTPPVVIDPAVQAATIEPDGDSSIDDAALQSAVEVTVTKII